MRAGEPRAARVMSDLVDLLRGARTSEPQMEAAWSPRHPSTGALVDALGRLHRGSRASPDLEASPDAPHAERYDRVSELFRRREQSLRAESLLVDRILDQMRRGAAPRSLPGDSVLQQTVRIACPIGGRSAARFLVVNETGAAVRVRPVIGRPNVRGTGPAAGAALQVAPTALHLESGATAVAEITVDLGGCDALAGETIDATIALADGEQRLGRVWVEIAVMERPR